MVLAIVNILGRYLVCLECFLCCRYKLRQDYLVEHGGYENEDWVVHTPVLKSFAAEKLTPEQAQATLQYFLLRQVDLLNVCVPR